VRKRLSSATIARGMNCPSCNAALEPNARFCGVCGHQISGGDHSAHIGPKGPPAGAATVRETKTTSPKPLDPFVGQVLNNRFKIESKIGEGGFGAVYRGVQLANGRKVALKLLHPEMTKDKNLVARFRREGLVLCNLKDAHTITTYDFDQTSDGTLYIAMELLEGKSLHQVFQAQAPLDWRRVFKIIGEMCSSLAEAHAQGIVHRDLKPENVYLEARAGNLEFVKILDFGIAKVMRGEAIDPQSPQLTATGQTLGTLEYMSPEQLMGKPLDGRSDVYALGVVAYEMITKRLPFPDAKGPAGLITAQLRQTPSPPSKANPSVQVPPNAEKIILKCLEKDRNNRYADVTALATAVQEALQQSGSMPTGGGTGDGRAQTSPHGEVAPMQLPQLPQAQPSGLAVAGMPYPQHHMHSPSAPQPMAQPAGSSSYPASGISAALVPMSPQRMPLAGPSTPRSTTHSSQPLEPVGVPSRRTWLWVMVGVVMLGAAAGAALALLL
jgi:eukaryotic-like serine/threonine-protein kinase